MSFVWYYLLWPSLFWAAVFAVIPTFQPSFNGHTWLRLHLHRQNKNRFWFLDVFWLLCYCWLPFSHKQGGKTFEGVFCTGENKWGTWIYSGIHLPLTAICFWHPFKWFIKIPKVLLSSIILDPEVGGLQWDPGSHGPYGNSWRYFMCVQPWSN